MRLDKFLVESSIGTRQKVRDYVKNGLIKVNGKIETEPAIDVNEGIDLIEYKDVIIELGEKRYYMFHKPGGCVTARRDSNCKTVMDYFSEENMEGIFHVGRLDKDTEGLLLFTNDGEFNKRLMSPEKDVEKTYFFWALGSINDDKKKLLEKGLHISEDEAITKPAKIEVIHEGKWKEFKSKLQVVKFYQAKGNNEEQPVVAGYLTISEGRKHQVKRMLKAVGCYVIYLKRISIGKLNLDNELVEGEYRELKKEEIKLLMKEHYNQ
ncbi:MAG: pseudouridine synthase [Clostridium sp.]